MKVGIVTITDNNNFGNRLQCYALFKVLKDMKYNVIEIQNDDKSLLLQIKRIVKKIFTMDFIKNYKKNLRFRYFNKKINRSNYIIDYNNPIEKEHFDAYIVGSDQVWNPKYGRLSNLDVLNFKTFAKKVSYAASFGISKLNNSDQIKLKYINRFDSISVREKNGINILKDVTANKIIVTVDPTLLLSKNEWNNICEESIHHLNDEYIFVYFLGGIDKSTEDIINSYANNNHLTIINILDKYNKYYNCGPIEFVSFIKESKMVFTDSFHASVFSFIFNKPFIVFNRRETLTTSSRIDNFLDMFSIENRKFNGKEISKENINYNYEKSYKLLEQKRKEGLSFIKNSLK